jgi:excisionase family DNA binding protein
MLAQQQFEPKAEKGPDPRAFGLVKAAYSVNETLDLLSIGRTSLYAAVKRGELQPVKFGKKTLFYAVDLAAFLTRLTPARGPDLSSRHANPKADGQPQHRPRGRPRKQVPTASTAVTS